MGLIHIYYSTLKLTFEHLKLGKLSKAYLHKKNINP